MLLKWVSPSNLASTYHEGDMSYAEVDTHDAGPHPYFYSESKVDIQHFDASCPPSYVVAEASDDLVKDDDSETEGEGPVHGPSEVKKESPPMLGEAFTPSEQAAPRDFQFYIDEVGNGEAEANTAHRMPSHT